ncbi:MAG: hypothetical protein CSA53_03055 [Gammaproteobacteria bacterium]|nr:MAG: hypothetical protein CSA53_03055 [Gammaproteobacteria bacterium]
MSITLKILTYNVHKGYDASGRRFVLDAIRKHIAQTGAHIVFLQEIHGATKKNQKHAEHFKSPSEQHYEYLADSMWPHYAYGRNAIYRHGDHGNAILSQLPFVEYENIDVAIFPRSSRSILHGVIAVPDQALPLHVLCVHLGLLETERQHQLQTLAARINSHVPANEPLIIAGDFNDWRGRCDARLRTDVGLEELFVTLNGRHARTFPVWAPVLAVDRIYYRGLTPISGTRLNQGSWRGLSDHAALLGELKLG